jgi:hypothetical protein
MAAGRNASHAHAYLTYPLQYDLFPKDMADLAKANSIRAMAIGFRVLAAMTDMVIGNKQLLQVCASDKQGTSNPVAWCLLWITSQELEQSHMAELILMCKP